MAANNGLHAGLDDEESQTTGSKIQPFSTPGQVLLISHY